MTNAPDAFEAKIRRCWQAACEMVIDVPFTTGFETQGPKVRCIVQVDVPDEQYGAFVPVSLWEAGYIQDEDDLTAKMVRGLSLALSELPLFQHRKRGPRL